VLVAFAVIGALMVGLRAIGNAVGIGFQLQHRAWWRRWPTSCSRWA
jgi:D-alanyl-lipoteichoic acid acyltransferase DltB (MBOAT superfamily)